MVGGANILSNTFMKASFYSEYSSSQSLIALLLTKTRVAALTNSSFLNSLQINRLQCQQLLTTIRRSVFSNEIRQRDASPWVRRL